MRVSLALVFLSLLASSSEAGKKKCHRKGGREIPLAIPRDQYAVKPTGPADNNYKLKTGPYGEYMGGSRGAQQVPFHQMHTVPVTRKTYEPRKSVKAAYVAEIPADKNPLGNKPAVMVADCQFKTKTPTINIDNFAQVKNIVCSAEQVTVTFDSDASAAKAAEEWGKAKDLSFIIGREWKCNGKDETAMRLVKGVTKGTEAKTLVFNAKPASREDVIDELEINVNQYNGRELPKPPGNSPLQKRWFWKWLEDLVTWTKSGNTVWELGINYDKALQSARNPEITIVDTPMVGVKCIECYAYGRAALSVSVRATVFVVRSYSVHVDGELKANMDLLVTAYATARTDLLSVTLFTLPLTPIQIPGVFSLGPELRLKAGVSYDLAEDLELTTGFTFHYPFSWSVSSDSGLFATPKTTSTGKPVLTSRAPQLSENFEIGIAAHLIPEVALSITVLSIPIFDVYINLDNALGVQLSRGDYSDCPDGAMKLMLFHQHSLNIGFSALVYGNNWPLWESGRLPLPCPNNACNRCLGSSTTSLLSSIDATSTTTVHPTQTLKSAKRAKSTITTKKRKAAQSTTTTKPKPRHGKRPRNSSVASTTTKSTSTRTTTMTATPTDDFGGLHVQEV